jgi:hypothetical protein
MMSGGSQPRIIESTTVLDCLGYDVSSKEYKTFMNITYSTDNNIISNAGQASILPGTSISINL